MIRRCSYALACAVLALTGERANAGTCLTADIMNPVRTTGLIALWRQSFE